VTGTVHVAPSGAPSYDVPGVSLLASTSAGDATVLPPWAASQPNFPYVFEFYLDDTNDKPVANAPVEFRRTGGVTLVSDKGQVTDTVRGTTDNTGWVRLLIHTRAPVADDVVGDVAIEISQPPFVSVVHNVRARAIPTYRPQVLVIRRTVGPQIQ
jgi:hypothetical protein